MLYTSRNTRFHDLERLGFGTRAMKKVKVCAGCGAIAKASDLFCRECGTPLPSETLFQTYKSKSRYCTVCDTIVTSTAQFCPKCGTQLK